MPCVKGSIESRRPVSRDGRHPYSFFFIERQLWNGDEQSAGLQPPAACLSKGRKLRVPGPGHFRVPLAALLFRDMPVWPQAGPESSVSTSVRESPYAVPRGHHQRTSVVLMQFQYPGHMHSPLGCRPQESLPVGHGHSQCCCTVADITMAPFKGQFHMKPQKASTKTATGIWASVQVEGGSGSEAPRLRRRRIFFCL